MSTKQSMTQIHSIEDVETGEERKSQDIGIKKKQTWLYGWDIYKKQTKHLCLLYFFVCFVLLLASTEVTNITEHEHGLQTI